METKQFFVSLEKAAGSGAGDHRFVMASSSKDRVNDTIEASALQKAVKGMQKLICLYAHDPEKPVGFWDQLKVEGGKLTGRLNLAPTNLSKMLSALIDHGTPLGASIGFKGAGARNKAGGVNFTDVTLLETSLVSIPCNPEAMQIAKSFGMEEFIEALSDGDDDVAASGLHLEEILQKSRAATLAANQTLRKVRS